MLPPEERRKPIFDYYLPGQFTALVEHPRDMSSEEVVERLRGEFIRLYDGLATAVITPARLQTFYRTPRPDQEPASPLDAFSLAFVEYAIDNAALQDILARLDEQIASSEEPGADMRLRLRAVSPNWLASSADPTHIGTGGPGAKPVPYVGDGSDWWYSLSADTPGTPFYFEIVSLPELQKEPSWYEVDVAVLDTAPSVCDLERAYEYWHKEHPLLRELLGPNGAFEFPNDCFQVSYAPSSLMTPLNHPANYFGVAGHNYRMIDHGLFAAGVIHTIAPNARLHLVQVLNDYGIGTLETIVAGLQRLAQRDLFRPLIVNLSLTLNLPLDKKHQNPRHPLNWPYLKQPAFLERMGFMLEWVCDELRARDVLLVAAAGNDARRGQPRPRARYPASFNSVVGVGALKKGVSGRGQGAAEYSNLSDTPTRFGIVTFGGDIMTDGRADPQNGMLGIYTGAFPNGKPSRNGWARWAGTSFAAPVVSGVLARLRGQGQSPDSAVQRVYGAETETGAPPQEQVLIVKQGP